MTEDFITELRGGVYTPPYYMSQAKGLMTCARLSVLPFYMSQAKGLMTYARLSALPLYMSQA